MYHIAKELGDNIMAKTIEGITEKAVTKLGRDIIDGNNDVLTYRASHFARKLLALDRDLDMSSVITAEGQDLFVDECEVDLLSAGGAAVRHVGSGLLSLAHARTQDT